MMKIGIFGGSFDPIHRSHISVIEESLKQLALDKLLVVPTANNPSLRNVRNCNWTLSKS